MCKEKRPLGRSRHRWEDDIKIDLKKIMYEGVDCVHLVAASSEHDNETSVSVDCCKLLDVMGRDFVSALQALWFIVLSPDESQCDQVSERDGLGLTPNLTTRDLWRSRRWAKK
jgi:hypothetical protein